MGNLDDFYHQISGYDEIINNEEVRHLLNEELAGKVIKIEKQETVGNLFYLHCLQELNGKLFNFTMLFDANDGYKFCIIRKESEDGRTYSLYDVAYNRAFNFISLIRCQKGDVQDENYCIENMLYEGAKFSYTSNTYSLKQLGTKMKMKKTDNFMESISSYAINRLTIDSVSYAGTNKYTINHNGNFSYISSDRLDETIDSLLSNGVHITLELK